MCPTLTGLYKKTFGIVEEYRNTGSALDKNNIDRIFLGKCRIYIEYKRKPAKITGVGDTKITMQFMKFPLHHFKVHLVHEKSCRPIFQRNKFQPLH
jgi:hypothetical protein